MTEPNNQYEVSLEDLKLAYEVLTYSTTPGKEILLDKWRERIVKIDPQFILSIEAKLNSELFS